MDYMRTVKIADWFARIIRELNDAGFDGGYGELEGLYEVHLADLCGLSVFEFRKNYDFESDETMIYFNVWKKGE